MIEAVLSEAVVVASKEDERFWSQFGSVQVDRAARHKLYYPWQKNYEQHKEHLRRRKVEVLTHYGNGRLACVKCGYSDLRALSLDHIDGSGKKDRRTSALLYSRLRREGYPDGFQTLCMNCQWVKADENRERYKENKEDN